MDEQLIYGWIIGLYVGGTVVEQVLAYLNLRHHSRVLPARLADAYDAETYARSYEYHRVNYRYSLVKVIPSFLLVLGLLVFGGFGWLDAQLRPITEHAVGLPLLFFGVLFLASELLSIPFHWYYTFVIEARFGFNKTTPRTFWLDKLKTYLLTLVIGGLILGVLLALIDWLGPGFWWWFWLFIATFSLFMQVFYTSLILPLFNKLTPMEAGSLREAIESYARGVDFPLDNVFVIDGSKRSEKSNAFFSGLGKRKKVVLYDTLVEKHSQEELVAVLAHEIGHYKKHHILQGMLIGIARIGLTLFILSRFIQSPELSYALGAEAYGIHLNLIAFGLLYSPISMVIGWLINLFSRKNEYEADHYAATTYDKHPLQQALIQLHEHNLSNLTPHPWYVLFYYSHPTLLQRLKALDQIPEPNAI